MNDEKRLRVFITVAALILVVIHLADPNLMIDGVTLALLVIAIIPWLAPIIKSIELPGGFKVELQEIKKELEEVRGAAQSAENKAVYAIAQQEPSPPQVSENNVDAEYERLAQLYNEIRTNQKSSASRTANMTKVITDMIALAPQLKNFNLNDALSNRDGGKRLSGYAYINARPDFNTLPSLVHALTQIEDKPFGQYWAIQALDKILYNRPYETVVDEDIIDALKNFLSRLDVGTDRHYELSRILRTFGK